MSTLGVTQKHAVPDVSRDAGWRVDTEPWAIGKNHRPFNGITQFTDVARPLVQLQRPYAVFVYRFDRFAEGF